MKKLIAGSLMASMLVVPAIAQDVSVYLNNQRMVFDQNPIIENGRTLVPLRSIFEGLGAEVKWNSDIQEVRGITDNKEIVLRVGDTSARVNGEEVILDVPAKIENGRTLVPLRFISESLDAEVKWNAEEYRIDIVAENTIYVDNSNALEYEYKAKKILEYETRDVKLETTYDMNCYSADIYTKWDNLLNEVYQNLKNTMSKEEFEVLKKEQIEWIKEKEKAIEEACAEYEGGSIVTSLAYDVGTSYTKERTWYLISLVDVSDKEDNKVPSDIPNEIPDLFYFSSGVGAWATELHLEKDGTFTGMYRDSDMGDIGEGYPNGTEYICKFSGKFIGIEKINDYTYSLILDYINYEYEVGKEWIENGILYKASEAYGLEGHEFLIYTPDAPKSELPEEFLGWKIIKDDEDVLGVYGIYNKKGGYGFF